jgi:hypothetical protein
LNVPASFVVLLHLLREVGVEVLLLYSVASKPLVLKGGGGGVASLGLFHDQLAYEVLRGIAYMCPLGVWEVVVGTENLLEQDVLAWRVEWWKAAQSAENELVVHSSEWVLGTYKI